MLLTPMWFHQISRTRVWKSSCGSWKFILWDMLLFIMLFPSTQSMCVSITTHVIMINNQKLLLVLLVMVVMKFYLPWKLFKMFFVFPTSLGIRSFPLEISTNKYWHILDVILHSKELVMVWFPFMSSSRM